jgi:chromate reductase, NAD(P)H dehydrogenase (quinone)
VRILGLSGSLRKASFNSALLRAAAQSMPSGAELDIGMIAGIPLYDGDLEAAEGLPGPVAELKEQIVRADGLLLVSPEYNNSLPGVFKNAIDWTTRPASDIDRVFKGKKVALMGVSAGAFGTILSQNAWLPVLRTLGMDLWSSGRLLVPKAAMAFDESGALVDDKIRARLRRFLNGFVAHLR